MSYDLLLQSHPGSHPRPPAGGWHARVSAYHPSLAFCEVLNLDGLPSVLDVDELADALECGELDLSEFARFCRAENLRPDPTDQRSATTFLESQDGIRLVSVHLPRSEADVRQAYSALVAFAIEHSVRLVDPQVGADVDLVNPGTLPAMWR